MAYFIIRNTNEYIIEVIVTINLFHRSFIFRRLSIIIHVFKFKRNVRIFDVFPVNNKTSILHVFSREMIEFFELFYIHNT